MKLKKVAKQRIQEVEQKIQNLPENVQVFSYVTLYYTLEELFIGDWGVYPQQEV